MTRLSVTVRDAEVLLRIPDEWTVWTFDAQAFRRNRFGVIQRYDGETWRLARSWPEKNPHAWSEKKVDCA